MHPGHPLPGIGIKLSIDNRRKCSRFQRLSQTLAQDLRCCASFAQRLGYQTFGGGTGAREKAAQDERRVKDRLHPPLGQGLEMPNEFEQTELTLFLPPEMVTHLWTERRIEQNEEHATIEI